jgi:hypothetical protein
VNDKGAIDRGFGLVVHFVHEHAHPLIAGAVGIDRAARFPRRLDFDAVLAGFDGIVRIASPYDQIGMPVEVVVDGQHT